MSDLVHTAMVVAMGDPPHSDDSLLAQLPLAYAVALRMDATGASPSAIATALGVEVGSVAALIEVGRRKLAELADGSH